MGKIYYRDLYTGKKQKKKQTVVSDNDYSVAKDLKIPIKKESNSLRSSNHLVVGLDYQDRIKNVILPNLLDKESRMSYIIPDPAGLFYDTYSSYLTHEIGYNVKRFSTYKKGNEWCYNPFDYIFDDSGEIDPDMMEIIEENIFNILIPRKLKKNNSKAEAVRLVIKAFLFAVICCNIPYNRNLHYMYELTLDWEEWLYKKTFKYIPKDAMEAISYINEIRKMPKNVISNIIKGLNNALEPFDCKEAYNITSTSYQVESRDDEGRILEFKRDKNHECIYSDENIDINSLLEDKSIICLTACMDIPWERFIVSVFYAQAFVLLFKKDRSNKKCVIKNKSGHIALAINGTRKDAERIQELYKNAVIIQDYDGIDSGMFIISKKIKNSDEKYWRKGSGRGYLRKIQNISQGEKLMTDVSNGSIEETTEDTCYHVRIFMDEAYQPYAPFDLDEVVCYSERYNVSCTMFEDSEALVEIATTSIGSRYPIQSFYGNDAITAEYLPEILGTKKKGKKSIKILSSEDIKAIPDKRCIVIMEENPRKAFIAFRIPFSSITTEISSKETVNQSHFASCKDIVAEIKKSEDVSPHSAVDDYDIQTFTWDEDYNYFDEDQSHESCPEYKGSNASPNTEIEKGEVYYKEKKKLFIDRLMKVYSSKDNGDGIPECCINKVKNASSWDECLGTSRFLADLYVRIERSVDLLSGETDRTDFKEENLRDAEAFINYVIDKGIMFMGHKLSVSDFYSESPDIIYHTRNNYENDYTDIISNLIKERLFLEGSRAA